MLPSILAPIVGFVIVFGVLVLFHEAGHFIAAKLAGVTVEEFGFGYPPRLLNLWRGRGFIVVNHKKLIIDHRRVRLPDGLKAGTLVRYQYETDDKGQHYLTHIEVVDPKGPPVAGASYVEQFDAGTRYTLNAIPFGGFVKMLGEEDPSAPGSLASKRWLVRFGVLVAGPLMNLLLAILLFSAIFLIGWDEGLPGPVQVRAVAPNSPAERAGIQEGDLVLSIDGMQVQSPLELSEKTKARVGMPVTLYIQRGEERLSIRLVPREHPPQNEGAMGVQISYSKFQRVRYPLWQAIPLGFQTAAITVLAMVQGVIWMIQGIIAPDVSGPITIARAAGEAVRSGLVSLLNLIAFLSINLCILNLIPFPGLDGGRLLFVIIEALRGGRRIAPEREGLVHLIGVAILLGFMLLISYYDIVRWISGQPILPQ
ncbi:MAG: site-2 protease family protein [Anaerolineae bacterium]|nr:site-2 protease family protein [Anaerolineae bacterium]